MNARLCIEVKHISAVGPIVPGGEMKKEVVSPRSTRTEVLAPGTNAGAIARTSWTGLGVGVHPGQGPGVPVFRLDGPLDPALCLLPCRDFLARTV